jgi:hypothetical protein
VGRVVYLGQVLEIEVGVDLRGRDAGVAEHLLHGAQVAGGLQDVRGERILKFDLQTLQELFFCHRFHQIDFCKHQL